MSSAPQVQVVRPAVVSFKWKVWLRKYFYFAMTLVCSAILLWGFGHTVPDVMLHPAIPRPKILWAHAILFSSWLLFAMTQTGLVRIHKVAWHRTLGWFGIALAAAMVVVGTMTAIQMGRFDLHVLHVPHADTFEIVSFGDMIMFPAMVGAAIVWRKDVELHRRLIFLATVELVGAGFGRIDWIFAHNLMFFCADALMCLGILRDWIVDGRVHRVYKYGIPALVVWHGWVTWMYLRPPGWWVRMAHSLMG